MQTKATTKGNTMKATHKITAAIFQQATGRAPKDDDLDRCNCVNAGDQGHEFCGWNYRLNVPTFNNRYDDPAWLVTVEGEVGKAICTTHARAIALRDQAIKHGKTATIEDY